MKSTKKQMDELLNCHVGVGFLMYKSAPNTITQTEFFLKGQVPCYLTTGKPIEFNYDDYYDDTEGLRRLK